MEKNKELESKKETKLLENKEVNKQGEKSENLFGSPEKKRRDFFVELALFLILGFLIGIAAKSEAQKRITIGFDDYKMNMSQGDYNIAELQDELILKAQQQAQEQENSDSQPTQQVESGASCGN